jgi:hypothetical protein
VDPAQVASLVEFGFPEANVRAALAASGGNPDMAYALLESGQPVSRPARKAKERSRLHTQVQGPQCVRACPCLLGALPLALSRTAAH